MSSVFWDYCKYYLLRYMPDKAYLQMYYFARFKKFINFNDPKTFNEKLNWEKLYYRNPLLTKLVDKYEVKNYVASKIGEDHVIPTLGVWEKFDDIDFDQLPESFVLKCTHDSAGLYIVRNKSEMDVRAAKETIENSLKHNFYYAVREWPYKDVPPRIIAEKYMEDEASQELVDYKFYCFNGVPKMLHISFDRKSGHPKLNYYDMDFTRLDIRQTYPNYEKEVSRPECFELMKALAAELSKGFPHVRVDLYQVNGKVFFGEMTFFSFGGISPFRPEKWDRIIGEWLTLPGSES